MATGATGAALDAGLAVERYIDARLPQFSTALNSFLDILAEIVLEEALETNRGRAEP